MDFALHVPINSLSLGQCSVAILREIYQLGYQPCLFTIGDPDLSAQKPDKEFNAWIDSCRNKALAYHSRKNPIIKLWHLNGGMESLSEKQILLSFYELDSPTRQELNIVKNNAKVVFTNHYTVDTFKTYGAENVSYVPLGFDKHNFSRKEKTYFKDDRINFLLCGKTEYRKCTQKIIKAWAKRFGNDLKYSLQCAIHNPFLVERLPNGQIIDHNQRMFAEALDGKKYFNVHYLNYMAQNELFNDFLNSGDIILGMSASEGWALPEFQAISIGKHAVILNAHAYKEYATPENAVLVNPDGKVEAYDNIFFHKGQQYNQGNLFSWKEEDFTKGCEEAIQRVKIKKSNDEGLKLQAGFTYLNTTKQLLKLVSEIL